MYHMSTSVAVQRRGRSFLHLGRLLLPGVHEDAILPAALGPEPAGDAAQLPGLLLLHRVSAAPLEDRGLVPRGTIAYDTIL